MARTGIGILLYLFLCYISVPEMEGSYVNVALNKTYDQISFYRYNRSAGHAANDNTGGFYNDSNCIRTTPYDPSNEQHWWQVDLGREYPVYNITLWARDRAGGFFNDRLYPSTITVDNQTCTTVTAPATGREQSVTCSSVMYGQVVRLALNRNGGMLNLCEFQIFVPSGVSQCRAGRWGSDCKQNCSDHCGKGPGKNFCDQDTAVCYDGCTGNFAGNMCEGCKGNFAGNFCEDCKDGYHGDRCDKECSTMTPRCTNCKKDGHCTACSDNYMPPNCTECQEGYYKENSNCIACPVTCGNSSSCNKTTGRCEECPPGKKGERCEEDCDGGQYGPSRCSLSCGQCQNDTQCDPVIGHCHTCQPGFYPPLCKATCNSNTYGQNCSESCGQCKGGQPCDIETGTCTAGCQPGYTGDDCLIQCESGFYGDKCNHTCGNCQNNTACHHETGHCRSGCEPGYFGPQCVDIMEQEGDDDDEPPVPMSVVVGASVGGVVAVILAVVVVVVCVRRRKGQQKSDSTNEAAVVYNNLDATDIMTGTTATCSDDSNLCVDHVEGAEKSEPDCRIQTTEAAHTKPKQSGKASGPVYENVTLQSAKPSTEPNTASLKTAHQQNGVETTKTTSKNQGKPPVSAKPSQGRAAVAEAEDEEEEEFKRTEAIYANASEEVYANIRPTGVRLDRLQATMVNRLRDGSLEEEFVRLVPKKPFPTKNGERKANHYKNRFTSILPYDKNRVVLEQVDGDDASDYVNASFVRGYRRERAYIAAQGPRDNTVDEFWRMVWQEGVTHIVMLTNIKEANKPKCYEYWPTQGDRLTTGHMEVTGVEEDTRAHYVIRTFDLKQTQSSSSRRVKQYHYQSWMDHEVPATTPLVNFWRYVRSRAPRTAEAPPLLVHCSAGVGRTGTFIALDIIIDHAQQEAEIDIYKTVDRLRDDRCHMVQNKGQYSFLHEAVVEAYLSGDSRLQVSDMDTVLPHTLSHLTPQHRIDAEFETLCKMRNCLTTPAYSNANAKENKAKNRSSSALPDDNHIVYLTKHIKNRNQYINAVYMSTFRQQRGSIMTQLPLLDTLIDFWRLVDGSDVSTIVSIGDVEGKTDMCRYWPRDATSEVKTGPYTVSLQSMARKGHTLFTYTLDMKTQGGSREVQVVHLAGWTGQVADNMADLLQLLTILHTSHKDRGGNPVIVQCIDGASQSGVVCALWDVISRMTCDAQLDVYMAVRQLHTVRPEAITSREQYRYCYQVAQQFRKWTSVYANTQ